MMLNSAWIHCIELKRMLCKCSSIYRKNCMARVHPQPIFVLGNQKSGTSAIAALLGELTGMSTTIDLQREIICPTFHRVYQQQISFSRFVATNRYDFSKALIKEPNLTMLYPQLADYFDNPRCLFIIRDPRDNLRSMLQRLQLPGDKDIMTSADRRKLSRAWRLVLDGTWAGLSGNYIQRLAMRWCRLVEIYLRYPQMLLCRYEDFAADKVSTLYRLAHDLHLPQIADITGKVNRQYQHKGDHNSSWQQFFGPANLQRIQNICGNLMKDMGYEHC